jgi:hypothetical protein
MSTISYQMKPLYESHMPKGKDSTGIVFEGPVLSGIKSVERRLFEDTVRLEPARSPESHPLVASPSQALRQRKVSFEARNQCSVNRLACGEGFFGK